MIIPHALKLKLTTLATIFLLSSAAQAAPEFQYEGFVTDNGSGGKIDNIGQIALDSKGRVFAVDQNSKRLLAYSNYSSNNSFLKSNSKSAVVVNQDCDGVGGTDSVDLVLPVSVTADPVSSRVYVLDQDPRRVVVYRSMDEGLLAQKNFCTKTAPLSATKDSYSIRSFGQNKFYLSTEIDGGSNRVVAFNYNDPTIKVLASMTALWAPTNLHLTGGSSGRLYVTNAFSDLVPIFNYSEDPSTGLVSHDEVDDPPLVAHPADKGGASFGVVTGVAEDSLGRVYVTERFFSQTSAGNRIRVYSNLADGYKKITSIETVQTPQGSKPLTGAVDVQIDGTRVYISDTPYFGSDKIPNTDSSGIWRLRFDDKDGDGKFDPPPPEQVAAVGGSSSTPSPGSVQITSLQSARDTLAPQSTIYKLKKCKRKKTVCRKPVVRKSSIRAIQGTATDQSGIHSVQVAIALPSKAKKRCRWLTSKRIKSSLCKKPHYITAKVSGKGAKVKWKLKLSKKLLREAKAGKWAIRSVAVDKAGNREKTFKARRNLLKLRIAK